MTALPVNELFETVQGEAAWTGTPAVFIRLQGCDVGCAFCDTKHTWPLAEARRIATVEMVEKVYDTATCADVEEAELVDLVCAMKSRHVVITGGEPCIHDLRPLTAALLGRGRSVQIETSGTADIRAADNAWVTLSPKIGMPGGLSVLPEAFGRADEIKMPVGKMADVEKLLAAMPPCGVRGAIWLQPLSQSEKATKLCIEVARERGWRVSIQTHKFIGVR
ncbi:7-carboxy-7-deazaguanine synthase QueE [Parvibaculum sp.]|uniref:7-carboxy-7-deazaguanine synthase QueE n=1 Tax=Parvibaculum sp. TaxID=2024848 RepID=UPI001DE0C15E|nr:7-carboxy-7-deazaguanine synthase QueE [Parvibaculum sp.]MBX3490890.1 7-carboxy-7-deazaguanine synthase QueE [Parvibaculum sp.]